MNDKSLSQTNIRHLTKLIRLIRQGNYVFIMGPNGMGKSRISKAAKNPIKNIFNYKYLLFSVDDESQNGAINFYNNLLQEISKLSIEDFVEINDSFNLSNKFIEQFEKLVNKIDNKIVLFFDGLGFVDRDIYDQFSKDCRKIYHIPNIQNKVLMVFIGSRVSTADMKTSPLWNITEKIEIKPLPENEAKKNINFFLKSLNYSNNNIEPLIYDATKGHIFLERNFIRFIVNNTDKNPEKYIEEFINYIWQILLNKEDNKSINNYEKKLIKHFSAIIKSLKENPEILRIYLNIQNNYKSDSNTYTSLKEEQIKITGLFSQNADSNYSFSNEIYKFFLNKCLSKDYLSCFCLMHCHENDLWKIGLENFKPLTKQEIQNPFIDKFSLISKIKEKIRSINNLYNYNEIFYNIIKYFIGFSSWGIYDIEREGEISEDNNFLNNTDPQNWLKKEKFTHLDFTIQQSFLKRTQIKDWTGKFLFIPVIIRQDFKRLFVAETKMLDDNKINIIKDIIFDSITQYSFILSTLTINKLEKSINFLKDNKLSLKDTKSSGSRMQQLWEWTRVVIENTGMKDYTYHQFFKDKTVISTQGSEQNLSKDRVNAGDNIIASAERINKGERNYYYEKTNSFFLGDKLDNGVIIMIEFSMPLAEYNKIAHSLETIFDLSYFVINTMISFRSRNDLLKHSVLKSDNYIYIIDSDYKILYNNQQCNIISNNLNEEHCFKAIYNKDNKCEDCPKNLVISNNEPFKMLKKIFIKDSEHIMDCEFTPIKDDYEDKVIAIAVHMHDLGIRHKLWKHQIEMEKLGQDQIDNYLLNALSEFGFKRIYRYNHDIVHDGLFISEDCTGDIKKSKIEDFKSGNIAFNCEKNLNNVVVWCHWEFKDDFIKSKIENRFKQSKFNVKKLEEVYYNSLNIEEKTLPIFSNFWITIPILRDNRIDKLYVLDNKNDNKLDDKLITFEMMQLLDTFTKAASQTRENIYQRQYFKDLPRMISHGIKESLGILRNGIYFIYDADDENEKNKWYNASNTALGMISGIIEGLLVKERGTQRIKKQDVDIKELLQRNTELFKIYSENIVKIDFSLILPLKSNFYRTDKDVLLQIINNLVGNSIHHFQKVPYQRNKKIWIKYVYRNKKSKPVIFITDNNSRGLPFLIKNYFNQPFKIGMKSPSGGFGLSLSREMIFTLGGNLEFLNTKIGTSLKLTL